MSATAARVQITLEDDILQRLIADMELENPPGFTLNAPANAMGNKIAKIGRLRGYYSHGENHVYIVSQGEQFSREGLYVMVKHLRFTVLHEMRHAWQREKWSEEELQAAFRGPYEFQRGEIDANQWADFAMPKYVGLVKVNRTRIGKSGFASLDQRAGR